MEREELFFAPEKVSAQDKCGEKHVFFKKKERLVHQKNTIFNIFRFFGDFFEKKKKRRETKQIMKHENWLKKKGEITHHVIMFCEAHEKRKKTKKEFKKQSCKNMTKEIFRAKKISQKGKWQKMSCFFFEDKNTEERDFYSSAEVTGSEKYQKKREQKKGPKKTKTPKKEKVQKRF